MSDTDIGPAILQLSHQKYENQCHDQEIILTPTQSFRRQRDGCLIVKFVPLNLHVHDIFILED